VICFALYGTTGPIRDELESKGVRCVDLDYTTRNRYLRRATFQLEFFRFLRRENVYGLHVHHATALVLCGIAAKFAGNVQRVVMTEHALHQLKDRPDYRQQATHYCRYADSITAVHPGIADYFHDTMAVARDRLHVITNGVRVARCKPHIRQQIRQEIGVLDNQFCFLFAGRLEAVKDVTTLLQAIALIPKEILINIRFAIAGDGSERQMLEALSHTLRIESNVRFLGIRTDVPNLLCAADGFIMTSVTEGLPMALIEAMAAKLPCIATAVGGIPELFADGVGMLVPPQQPDQIAKAICKAATTPELCADLANKGFVKAKEKYDLDAVVTRYLELLGLPSHWPSSTD
jgi:glycosyltransferase involved in cell wall biosynthesis